MTYPKVKYLKSVLLSFALAAPMALGSNAASQTYFIENATLVTPGAASHETGLDIVVADGVVTQSGADLSMPAGAQRVSGQGLWVTPGIFAPLSGIGLVEVGAESSTNDMRSAESKTSISELAADSFNPKAAPVAVNRVSGITTAAIINAPSHNIFSGVGIIANLTGEFDSIVDPHSFIYVQLGSSGADIAGGSRSAALAQLRAALSDAAAYPSRYKGPEDGDALSRRDAGALAGAARGYMPIIIGADRASDLMNIIDLKADYGDLDIIIAGAAEGWMVADKLASARIKVIVDPLDDLPGNFDRVGSRIDNAAILSKAGVELAIFTRSSDNAHNVRVIRQFAGNAVANGLPWDTAFAAISSVPARWFDVDIKGPGKGSSLVVWDGDPLEVTTSPVKIWIGGAEQSLTSRQTELRDRYNPTRQETKPYKYR